MTSENARRDGRKKWTCLKSTAEKTVFIVKELNGLLGPFNDFNGKQPEGIALTRLPEYSYHDENTSTHNSRINGKPVVLKEIEQIIQEMTDIPPLIERIDLGRKHQNGKLKSLSDKLDSRPSAAHIKNGKRNGGSEMSVDGIIGVMSMLERPVSPLSNASSLALRSSPKHSNIKFAMKQRSVDKQRLPEFSDSETQVEETLPKVKPELLPRVVDNLITTGNSSAIREEDKKRSRNLSPPRKMQKLEKELQDNVKKQKDYKGKTMESESGKKCDQKSYDRERKQNDKYDRKSYLKDENPTHEDKGRLKSRIKSPEKRPTEKPIKVEVKPCASERNVSTPEIRPNSRLNSNKPTFRAIKPPSFAIGEYEGYDYPGPSRADLPDQCVFMNRRKIPNHQELMSSVRQFIRSIPPNVISLGCMTRSLYSVGLLLYSLSPSHTTTESDLRQALALLRSVTAKLFNGHSALPKNKHIVKGLLCLSEALICTKLYIENQSSATKRRTFLKTYEDILRPMHDQEDGEILDSNVLHSLITDSNKNIVSKLASVDKVTIPRVLYKALQEENAYSRLAEQALLASTMARNELEVHEQTFLRRLREMRFDVETSASALGDAIFTVTFWMQRSTRFKPRTEPPGLRPT